MSMNARVTEDTIALVGIGCRLPGGVHSPADLWDLLLTGSSNVTGARPDRFPDAAPADTDGDDAPNLTAGSGAFFAPEELENFDNEFFGISPKEARRTDPQHRLLLETAWEALEDAGIPLGSVEGGNGGVFIGQWTSDFEALALSRTDEVDLYSVTGSGRYAASGRLSYKLGMRGPSLTIDTACSSASVANHLACAAIRGGECDIALVGGANVILRPELSVAFDRAGMVSPGSTLKFGDANADGFLRSEGAMVLVLKAMSTALADGDNIYAAISGSAVNNDGTTGKYLTSPGVDGHKKVLSDAWKRAEIQAVDLSYVEAHGTGTVSGDRTELIALGEAFVEGGRTEPACPIGSIKTNVGHLEGSSGLVGLAKAALVLKHGTVPPTLNIDTPNPAVDWSVLRPVTEIEDLHAVDGVAHVGITCYGLGGTNVHTVMTTPPPPPEHRSPSSGPPSDNVARIVPLSARHPVALAELAAALRDDLETHPEALVDLAHSATHRRTSHTHRAAVVADDIQQLKDGLGALADGRQASNLVTGRFRPAGIEQIWVASPTAPWDPDAFRALIRSVPAAAEALDAVRSAFSSRGPELLNGPDGAPVDELNADTRSFLQQYIWASVLRSLDLRPNTVLAVGSGAYLGPLLTDEIDVEKAVAVLLAGDGPIEAPFGSADSDCAYRTCDSSQLPKVMDELDGPAVRWVPLGPEDLLAADVNAAPRGEAPTDSLTEVVLGQAAQLFTVGAPITWPSEGRFVDLPRYRWQRRRAWPDDVGAVVRSAEAEPELEPLVGLGRKLAMLAHRQDDHVWQGNHPAGTIDQWLTDPDLLAKLVQTTVGEDLGQGPWDCQDLVLASDLAEVTGHVSVQLAVISSDAPSFELSINAPDGQWATLAHGGLARRMAYPLPAPIIDLLAEITEARRSDWLRERVIEQVAIAVGDKPSARLDLNIKLSTLQAQAGFEATLRERLQALTGVELPADATDGSRTIANLANQIDELLTSASPETPADGQESSSEQSTDDLAKALSDMLSETGTP